MLKSAHTMCTTWAQAMGSMWAKVVCKYAAIMRVCTNADLYATYPVGLHYVNHSANAGILSVIGQVIPTFHSTYKEPETYKLNNTNTKACGERS